MLDAGGYRVGSSRKLSRTFGGDRAQLHLEDSVSFSRKRRKKQEFLCCLQEHKEFEIVPVKYEVNA